MYQLYAYNCSHISPCQDLPPSLTLRGCAMRPPAHAVETAAVYVRVWSLWGTVVSSNHRWFRRCSVCRLTTKTRCALRVDPAWCLLLEMPLYHLSILLLCVSSAVAKGLYAHVAAPGWHGCGHVRERNKLWVCCRVVFRVGIQMHKRQGHAKTLRQSIHID